jgi:outer membrane protein
MKTHMKFLAIAIAALAAQGALAQSQGSWMVRAGATTIKPQVSSGDLSPPGIAGSKLDVGSASQLTGGITYMYTDNISVDLPLALPFAHKLYGAGVMQGVGQVAEVNALPLTVSLQYRFMDAKSAFRPYVGLGATYAYFFGESGTGALTATTNPGGPPTTVKVQSKFTLTPQIGITMAVNDRWFVDAYYSMSKLSTSATLSTGQSIDMALDPISYGLSVGYKF